MALTAQKYNIASSAQIVRLIQHKSCSYLELLTLRSLIEEELKAREKQTREEMLKEELHQEILMEKDNENES